MKPGSSYITTLRSCRPIPPAPACRFWDRSPPAVRRWGTTSIRQTFYELQNNTTSVHGSHTWRFGIRARFVTDDNVSPQNFNGTFTFSGGLAPVARRQPATDCAALEQIDSIERYRRTVVFQQMGLTPAEILARGGGASQFSIAAGYPGNHREPLRCRGFRRRRLASASRPHAQPGTALREPAQHSRRRAISRRAWDSPGRPAATPTTRVPKPCCAAASESSTIASRFPTTLAAARYNGIVQQQYVVTNPDFFPNVPAPVRAGRVPIGAGDPAIEPVAAVALRSAIRGDGGAPVAEEYDAGGHLHQFARAFASFAPRIPMRPCRVLTIRQFPIAESSR